MENQRSRDPGQAPLISVVIPTHNRSHLLRQTLQHLAPSTLHQPWDVVVVANACADDTPLVVAEVAAAVPVPIRLVEHGRPSAAAARNRGARAGSGELLVFLDDDILLEPEGLARIADWYEQSDGSSLLVGQVLPLAEHVATPFGAFRQLHGGAVPKHAPPDDVDWFASGLAAVPAAAFDTLGGYSESYPAAGLEDADFAIRVRRAGLRIIFHPAVTGLHNDWAGATARDYCRRAAAYCATAPLLAERFPDNDHPWARTIEVNRPPSAADHRRARMRKRLKQAAVAAAADRWLPAAADRVPLPPQARDVLYRAAVSVSSYAGYQTGLRRLAEARTGADLQELLPADDAHGLSIVIVTYNCRDEVERTIESLHRHPPSVSHEILVADNASNDGTVERLRDRFPDVTVIPLEENLGYGSAVNLAVKETDGHYLLLLNPDTEVTEGAVDTLLRHAAASPGVGVVGPRLVLGTGLPQSSARRLPAPWRLWLEVSRLHLLLPLPARGRMFAGTYSPQDRPGRVDWVSGACHLVPRAVWEQIGGLTERTFCGFDDLDYCWRAGEAGYHTLFCPDATVIHHCGVSVSRRWSATQVDELAIHNAFVIFEDHWPRHRIKLYCAAELTGTLSDILLGARRSGLRGSEAAAYTAAARARAGLLTRLLLDRIRPIERCEPGAVGAPAPASRATGADPMRPGP